MASSPEVFAGEDLGSKKATLVSRRCIILALVGSTSLGNSSVDTILRNGYLSTVKHWMDDILSGSVGGVDLLLHLLTNITHLPVTKSIVKESGMGKAIGSVEKNKICVGTLNEVPIKERVANIKEAWNKSVKARKEKSNENETSHGKATLKRGIDAPTQVSAPIGKKPKVEESKKSSSLSNLMKKMAPTRKPLVQSPTDSSKASEGFKKVPSQMKQQKKRVKWKDHFGGNLTASKILENADSALVEEQGDVDSVSWFDRRKRDRLREKELLAKAKKAKLTDDDEIGTTVEAQAETMIQPTISWHTPMPLPEWTDAPPPQVNSKEKVAQTTRMASVTPAGYASEYNVPKNPTPLSDVEQALDMTSQSSTATQLIPFFVPQAPVAAPAAAPASQMNAAMSSSLYSTQHQSSIGGAASVEMVQSLGLPMFLVGQNVQALQTLAATPSLLSTFVDNTGMYDQVRLTSLVQTLSQGSSTGHPQPATSYPPSSDTSSFGGYNPDSGSGIYGPASSNVGSGGYRGAQNNGEGNLHLSGYGPSTTQSEIIALFSPYVVVDEVVMKMTFCFVNTSDPIGAKMAREALNGALLGGQPVRINMATRKNRDTGPGVEYAKGAASTGSYYGNQGSSFTPPAASTLGFGQPPAPPPPLPLGPPPPSIMTSGDFSHVRDDRGNPATKNLFVAGYGQGTSETLLRQVFSSHCEIVGIIVKGTFSFINTADKAQAINAREVLSGTMLNGGVLRINFAKESGRLGTSFDLTYGNKAQPRSHYGPRGF